MLYIVPTALLLLMPLMPTTTVFSISHKACVMCTLYNTSKYATQHPLEIGQSSSSSIDIRSFSDTFIIFSIIIFVPTREEGADGRTDDQMLPVLQPQFGVAVGGVGGPSRGGGGGGRGRGHDDTQRQQQLYNNNSPTSLMADIEGDRLYDPVINAL